MENKQLNENTEKLQWNKPEVQILTINHETSIVLNGSTPPLVDHE